MSDLNEEQLATLKKLAIPPEDYAVLFLLPVVEVAWIDGKIQKGERTAILAAAADRDLLAGKSKQVVERWLDSRPGRVYFKMGRGLLKELLDFEGAETLHGRASAAIQLCWDVAASAGGVLGIGSTSAEERELIVGIVDQLTAGNLTIRSKLIR